MFGLETIRQLNQPKRRPSAKPPVLTGTSTAKPGRAKPAK